MNSDAKSGEGKLKSSSMAEEKKSVSTNLKNFRREQDMNAKTNSSKSPEFINRSGRVMFYFGILVALLSILCSISSFGVPGREMWPTKVLLKFFDSAKGHGQPVPDGKARAPVPRKVQSVPNNEELLWTVDRRCNLSLGEFVEKYDGKRPVLITDALDGWKANNWSKEFFANNYGDQRVVMKAVQGSLKQAESLALPMKLYAKHSNEGSATMWTYLQDELFIQLHPELRKHLGEPIYLKEDFFQLFPVEVRPWNAMLLWGTPYSRSYLHIDPYNWTGTNAVFSGKKLWKLYPPGQDEYLYVIPNRKSEFPLNCFKYNSAVDAFNPDLKTYPRFAKARAISFAQKPGELLIIPPGWFHQAFNEVETIAVSSQIMNSQNFHIILEEIFKAGDIDRNKLPSDFSQMSPVDQVLIVIRYLPARVIQRGKEVTADILKQMGYPAST